jgi:predicted dehydrogenase
MIEGKAAVGSGRQLKYGMIGGGPGSFIGGVHRAAIALGGTAVLTAGCFSDIQEEIDQAGQELRLDPDRVYRNFAEMAEKEAAREDKIDFVVIVAPNRVHFGAAKAFLEKGFNVMCEKPLTVELEDALELKRLATKNGCLFSVSYAYSGHVMAKEARALIKRGEIGDVLVVMGEYPQEWLIDLLEKNQNQRQAVWRTDPKLAGKSNCLGDIGTHIENMVSYMTGLRIKQVCASMDIFGEGRTLDTNTELLIRFENGARGSYWCSQVAIGYDNGLKIRIFGTKGSIEFDQEKCNYLKLTKKGQPPQMLSRGNGYILPEASAFSRIPSGHPEGYFEAYANIYKAYSQAIQKKLDGEAVDEADFDYPGIDMGIDGVRFIAKCVESNEKGSVWVDFE